MKESITSYASAEVAIDKRFMNSLLTSLLLISTNIAASLVDKSLEGTWV